MRTLSLVNQKGGVGKSAVACMLAHYLTERGKRVLVIDLDHQGNSTRALSKSGRPAITAFGSDQVMLSSVGAPPVQPFVLVPSGPELKFIERQPALHKAAAGALLSFLHEAAGQFDACLIDTNPNPDIRQLAALLGSDCVLCPMQLNQESIDGIAKLLTDDRVGILAVQGDLNPRLRLLGLLPNLVEPTPFQRANLVQLLSVPAYRTRLLAFNDAPASGQDFCRIARRSAIAEAQAAGARLWDRKDKTAWRDAWTEIRPVMDRIAELAGVAP